MLVGFLTGAATLWIAYANGANDNFKGVATLYGSGTTDYRQALTWATFTTLLGSMSACFLAQKLIRTFSGKGLVPDSLVTEPAFLLAVILGAGLTVYFSSQQGIPISTTHSLTGALTGSGLAAIGAEIALRPLGKNFFLPLIFSPLLAIVATALVYAGLRWARVLLKIKKTACVCVETQIIPIGGLSFNQGDVIPLAVLKRLDIFVDKTQNCQMQALEQYAGKFWGIEIQKILDAFHFMSAGAVCFARGLNDTPKIIALAVAAGFLGLRFNILLVSMAMVLGGLLGARKVAEVLAHRITSMNHGQGFTANLMTSCIVIGASLLGAPVSTTHVSCGALFGIGLVNGKAQVSSIRNILAAWVLTLPVSAGLSGLLFFLLKQGLGL